MIMVWTSCADNVMDGSELSDAAAGKSNNPKSQSSASDYNVSLASNGSTFTYTITKNAGAKDLGHFIVNLDNCGEESARLARVLSSSVNGVATNLDDTEGSGTGCAPTTTNFVKFDNLPKAAVLELSFTLDLKYDTKSSTGWLKAGTSCNSTTIGAPGCPIIDECAFGQGYFFSNGSGAWPNDVVLGGHTYTKAEGQALWYGGYDNNVQQKAFFQYCALYLSGSLAAGPQDAVAAIEAYFTNNPNKLTSANIGLGLFSGTHLSAARTAIGNWIDENQCD